MLIYWIVLGIITPLFYFPLKKFFSPFTCIVFCIYSFILAAFFPLILTLTGTIITSFLYSFLILIFGFIIYFFQFTSKYPTCQVDNKQIFMLAEPVADINQEIISYIYEPSIEETFIKELSLEQLIQVEPVVYFQDTIAQIHMASGSALTTDLAVSLEQEFTQDKPSIEILTEVEDRTENELMAEPTEVEVTVQAMPEVEVEVFLAVLHLLPHKTVTVQAEPEVEVENETVPVVFNATELPLNIELAPQDKVRDLITNGINNYRQGNYIQAGKNFHQAIQKQPDTDLLYIAVSELSSVYQHLGFYYLAAELLRFYLPVLEKSLHPGVQVLNQKLDFIEGLYQLLLQTNLSRLPYSEVPDNLKNIAFSKTVNDKH